MMTKDVPILFVIFNRPTIAAKTFKEIKKVKPSRLYIASDGPRENKHGESEIVCHTRQTILKMIDWECEVKTLFREKNIGCGDGVYTAINWFFENEEMGIILEDDCLISSSFYQFISELLERYKDDTRIGMIAGTNQTKKTIVKDSYLFSRYKACWGWATWKRAWANMDMSMTWRDEVLRSVIYNSGFGGKDNAKWIDQLKCIDNKYVSAWDWQWYFSLSAQNQLCIFPAVNLVTNIGNTADATHMQIGEVEHKSFILEFPLTHPQYVLPNYEFEKEFYEIENSIIKRVSRMLPHKLKMYIKKMFFYE